MKGKVKRNGAREREREEEKEGEECLLDARDLAEDARPPKTERRVQAAQHFSSASLQPQTQRTGGHLLQEATLERTSKLQYLIQLSSRLARAATSSSRTLSKMGLLDDLDALTAKASKPSSGASKSKKRAAVNDDVGSSSRAPKATLASRTVSGSSAALSSRTVSGASKASAGIVVSDDDEPAPRVSKPKAKASISAASTKEKAASTVKAPAAAAASKAKGKAKAAASTEEASSERMPFYDAWTLKELQVSSLLYRLHSLTLLTPLLHPQAEVKRYGFRTSSSHSVLVSQLSACWAALHPNSKRHATLYDEDEDGDIAMYEAASPRHSSGNTGDSTLRSTWSGMASDADASYGDVTLQLAREAAGSPDSSQHDSDATQALSSDEEGGAASDAEAEASPANVPASLSSSLVRAVQGDKQLYRRILLLEPVSFDEVHSTATRAGVKVKSKDVLRDWLDKQGICFYVGELTGQRSRY